MDIEVVWYYTGFVFWVMLAWVLIGAMAWLGAQFIWAVWKKYGTYKTVVKLLDFLDENTECGKQFEDWLLKTDQSTGLAWYRLRKFWKMWKRR